MKVALITGSSRGLGLEISKELSKHNYHIILTGRSREKIDIAVKELSSDAFDFYCGDLLDSKFLQSCLNDLAKKNIVPDIIVHNLGGKVEGDQQPLTKEVLLKSTQLNLGLAVEINNHFLPMMQERKSGKIIHISSDGSLSGQCAPGYAAAKAAVNGYVKSTARYYAKHNIMICAVLPGVFEHDSSVWSEKKKLQPDYYMEKIKQTSLGRFLFVEEVASCVSEIVCGGGLAYAGSLVELTGAYR